MPKAPTIMTREAIEGCIARRLSQREAAAELGCSVWQLRNSSECYGIAGWPGPGTRQVRYCKPKTSRHRDQGKRDRACANPECGAIYFGASPYCSHECRRSYEAEHSMGQPSRASQTSAIGDNTLAILQLGQRLETAMPWERDELRRLRDRLTQGVG